MGTQAQERLALIRYFVTTLEVCLSTGRKMAIFIYFVTTL